MDISDGNGRVPEPSSELLRRIDLFVQKEDNSLCVYVGKLNASRFSITICNSYGSEMVYALHW